MLGFVVCTRLQYLCSCGTAKASGQLRRTLDNSLSLLGERRLFSRRRRHRCQPVSASLSDATSHTSLSWAHLGLQGWIWKYRNRNWHKLLHGVKKQAGEEVTHDPRSRLAALSGSVGVVQRRENAARASRKFGHRMPLPTPPATLLQPFDIVRNNKRYIVYKGRQRLSNDI